VRILVISDTHGDTGNLEYLVRTLGNRLDLLIHLGDGAQDLDRLPEDALRGIPCMQVKGNMDSDPRLPPSRVTQVRRHLIYVSHGHAALASGTPLPMILAAREAGASVCLFGHTHIPQRTRVEGMLVLNPGSLSRPRGGWGPTFALLKVPEDGVGRIEALHYEIRDPGGRPSLRVVYP